MDQHFLKGQRLSNSTRSLISVSDSMSQFVHFLLLLKITVRLVATYLLDAIGDLFYSTAKELVSALTICFLYKIKISAIRGHAIYIRTCPNTMFGRPPTYQLRHRWDCVAVWRRLWYLPALARDCAGMSDDHVILLSLHKACLQWRYMDLRRYSSNIPHLTPHIKIALPRDSVVI